MDPKTIGQFSGRYDKNGEELYHGDIFRHIRHNENSSICVILYSIENLEWSIHDEASRWDKSHFSSYFDIATHSGNSIEKIGNIFDNPELAKRAAAQNKMPLTHEDQRRITAIKALQNFYPKCSFFQMGNIVDYIAFNLAWDVQNEVAILDTFKWALECVKFIPKADVILVDEALFRKGESEGWFNIYCPICGEFISPEHDSSEKYLQQVKATHKCGSK